jgi:putative ABC transport system permease protein
MLRTYLVTARRALQRRLGLTVLNVAGLAVGLAACLLIGLWVQHQLSYDRFHPAADRIVRVGLDGKIQDRTIRGAVTPAALAPALRNGVPEVEAVTRFEHPAPQPLRADGRTLPEQRVADTDAHFLDVFGGFTVRHGDRATALDAPDAVVLTAPAARRLFGTDAVVGRALEVAGATRRVTAVLDPVPAASHVHFDALTPRSLSERQGAVWASNNFRTYLRLAPGAAPAAVQAKLDALVETQVAPQIAQVLGKSFGELQEEGLRYAFFVQPLTAIHLHAGLDYEMEPGGSRATVVTFAAIALFILAIACINFMNLATARAAERATEVGVRKALGAGRGQLAGQFVGEAVLTTLVAAALALSLAAAALPAFNDVAETDLALRRLLAPGAAAAALALVLGVGLAAGSYPAFVLSRFRPAVVLKSAGRRSTGGHGARLRQGLVVLQLAITIALLAGTFVVERQFSYVQTKRLGLDKERVLVIDRAQALGAGQDAFAERLRGLPGVAHVASGTGLFDGMTSNTGFIPDDAAASTAHSMDYLEVDAHFTEALGIEVVSGRGFDAEGAHVALVNEAAARAFGWTDAAGHRLRNSFSDDARDAVEVVGIVRDFHYASMREAVRPLVLLRDTDNPHLYVRLSAGAPPAATLEAVQAAWRDVKPGEPLPYAFLDQTYDALHRDVARAGTLFSAFAALAVALACLGLFGLATYAAQRRTQEIGLRKALGASTLQLTWLLNREVAALVGVGFAVAAPLAYLGLRRWLDGFAYRIDLGAGVFLLAGALALALALATVGVQAWRAARMDPVRALRDE